MGLDRAVEPAEVDALVAFFESRGEEATVEICSFTDPSFVTALGARGFVVKHLVHVHAMPFQPTMHLDPPELDGITIDRLDRADAAAVRAVAEHNERGFAPPGQPPSTLAIELTIKALSVPSSEAFVARSADGAIVGVGCSDSSEGLTVLFGATVVPAFRRQGLQRSLMLMRLRAGLAAGSDLACVMTTPGIATERNATRLGFAMAYTRIALRRPLPR